MEIKKTKKPQDKLRIPNISSYVLIDVSNGSL